MEGLLCANYGSFKNLVGGGEFCTGYQIVNTGSLPRAKNYNQSESPGAFFCAKYDSFKYCGVVLH